MLRQFKIKEENFKRAMRFYRHLVRDEESAWSEYVRSPT